ncbi:DUF2793 domain-containing protein [Devosia sp. SD17-2]|uniref:DUF2793 domain-containing protein n=1 Tax=Devosia sp. SD17-2 TaxID=2976459 RepID=UPI0023D804F4|nr:DUF2793 domain-containing protein [Devosia sp. SD17-2]WEJ33152.1 DUF2793 domain-containing protein [Devosia sp. SD17-2]
MDQTARLELPFIVSGQALKFITRNEALERLDMLVQPVVEDAGITSPPMSPLPGAAYIVPTLASGAWSGHGGEIAAYQAGAWRFYDPAPGWQVFDRESGALKILSGSAWVAVAAIGDGLPQLGVNASAHGTNRLSLASDASLFSHDGGGHQLKINKADADYTASLLFQSNWTGHAEMGLMGDTSWRIKVSADGVSWSNAITIDATTALVTFAGGLRPASDNSQSLGSGTARWSAVWSATGTIQTSDRREKTDIVPTDLGLDFVCSLNPVRFAWKSGEGGVHYGLLAQEVADALASAGVSGFGGLVLADPDDPESPQGLRYDQFIAPLIAAVQALTERITALEARA